MVEGNARAPRRKQDLVLLVLRYVDERRKRQEIGPKSAYTYRKTLLNWALSDTTPSDPGRLRRSHIQRWMESRSHLTRATVRTQLSIVRGFCEWMVITGIRKTDPSLGIRGPRQPRYLPRGRNRAEVKATFDGCPDTRAVLIVCLEVQEGLRACEVVGLELGDIDVEHRQVLVRISKGDNQRVVPISDETWTAMSQYLVEHPARAGHLIRSYNHPTRGITAGYCSQLVSGWMHGAGVNGSGHALRHTAATDSLLNGAHLIDIQAALGHRSIETTRRYLPFQTGDLRKALGGRTYRTDPPAPAPDPPAPPDAEPAP
jgi:integrase/recombinase XerC